MGRINYDFSQVAAYAGFEPVPPGAYVCRIEKVEETTSNSGKPMIKFELKIMEPAEHADKPLFDNAVLVKDNGEPNKLGYGQVKAYAVAAYGEEWANNPAGYETEQLQGQIVMAEVGTRTYPAKNSDGSPQLDAEGKQVHKAGNEIKRILPHR